MKYDLRKAQLFCGLLFLILIALLWGHIPHQDSAAAFDYADRRELFGIPCFMDVVSNFAFALIGALGLWKLRFKTPMSYFKLAICLGIIWTAVGSSYFHLDPGNERIFWDRLPMSIVFGTVLGWLIADKVHFKSGVIVGVILSLAGALSLILWKLDLGDLKPYFILQYGGLVLAILICLLIHRGRFSNMGFLISFSLYVVAKVLEKKDLAIFTSSGWISGHSLKHLAAALAVGVMLSLKDSPQRDNVGALSKA